MFCLRIYSNSWSSSNVKVVIAQLIMPKYAVAVGRKVGIYDTYDECKLQVVNYPKAKYKKFDKIEDAEEFIKQFSGIKVHHPIDHSNIEVFPVSKPSLAKNNDISSLTNQLSKIEEKLNKFISDTTSVLDNLVARVKTLEAAVAFRETTDCGQLLTEDCEEPPLKKVKEESSKKFHIKNGFLTDDSDFVAVYTDGACSNNGQKGAQAGIGVWFNDDHPLNVSEPVEGLATNNNAEIQAARVAITQALKAGIRKLCINTDSKFVINCITAWIHKWKKNNWQLSGGGGSVKNKEELVKLDNAIKLLESVQWNYVAGHKGVRGNEMADKLAREGACKYKSS